MISVYKNYTEIAITPRRIETIEQYNQIIQQGRRNPVWFIEKVLGIQLLDYQKYVVMGSWDKSTVCWVFSRNAGKSILGGIYIATRSILFPSHTTYIMSGTSKQSQDTFMKIENIAKNNIPSIKKSNGDIILGEAIATSNAVTGFSHNKDMFVCHFYNGSSITSLPGDENNIVGKRSNLNVYDEAGKLSKNFFDLTEPFTAQNMDFSTGGDIDMEVLPPNIPTQCLYMSSAEDVGSHLYAKYKSCAKRMMMGMNDAFCADLNCEIPLHPTMDGKPHKPLLMQTVVDEAMRTNEYKALREYYNIFDSTGGIDCIVGRDVVRRNERPYLPVFVGDNDPNKIYGIFYDPASRADNSFVLIGEFHKDEDRGWMARVVNGINLLQVLPNGEKKTMRSTEQLRWIQNLMAEYNGHFADWNRIHLFIDPGSGGGGNIYADFLTEEFEDKEGIKHVGVIDLEDEFYKEEKARIPSAVPGVLRLLGARKYKNPMFDSIYEMTSQDLVSFPEPLPSDHKVEIDGVRQTLTKEQVRAILEIDLMKEELFLMRKTVSDKGNVIYALAAQEQNRAHDDRAYCLSALCYYLQQLRRDDQFGSKKINNNMNALLKGIGKKSSPVQKAKTVFTSYSNNFTRK